VVRALHERRWLLQKSGNLPIDFDSEQRKTVSMPRRAKYFSTGYCIPIHLPPKDDMISYGGWSAPWGDSGTVVVWRHGDIAKAVIKTKDERHEQEIKLVYTQPFLGGRRAWFVCPCCRRRVGRLWWPNGGWAFHCRHCWGLRYYSQRLTPEWRARNQAEKMVRRMGGSTKNSLPSEFPPKPKGMHWSTYNRRFDRWIAKANEWLELEDQSFGRLLKRYGLFFPNDE
jgi:hypothetical protein